MSVVLDIQSAKDRMLKLALAGDSLNTIISSLCETISGPLEIYRMGIGMPTLHPLVEAKSIRWTAEEGIGMLDSEHGYSEQEDWLKSPIYHMFEHRLKFLRYRLDLPGDWHRFPLLHELACAGCTEYYATVISFNEHNYPSNEDRDGMLASWATDRPGGFSAAFFEFVKQIKPALGIVCKLADRESAAVNILEAYLGTDAGNRVLKGQIERGELVTIDAVVWYSDLRQSTWLAENLSNQDFLDTLNVYFECTAGSVMELHGEVLRFIGDAVLAIFPIEIFASAENAAESAWRAAKLAQGRIQEINVKRSETALAPLNFGLALHAGSVDYGNIGIPCRLEFSVIGTVANEVARLEGLTKTLGESILVSESFARLLDIEWKCMGSQPMKGVKNDPTVYAPVD